MSKYKDNNSKKLAFKFKLINNKMWLVKLINLNNNNNNNNNNMLFIVFLLNL